MVVGVRLNLNHIANLCTTERTFSFLAMLYVVLYTVLYTIPSKRVKMPKNKTTDEPVGIANLLSIGELFKYIPAEKVSEALCATAKNDKREKGLPARQTLYLSIALSYFGGRSSREVLRSLSEPLRLALGPSVEVKVPTRSAISQARERLGIEPLEHLYRAVVRPLAIAGKTKGAFFAGRRLVAIDAFVFNTPDTAENDKEFGRPSSKKSPGPYPQVRLVGLIECATRVAFDYEMSGCSKASEQKLAEKLLPRLQKGQLCLADRLYPTRVRWDLARATGADLLWRVKADIRLAPEKILEDGTYMSTLYSGDRRKRTGKNKGRGTAVRVIDFEIECGELKERYRLLTTLTPEEASPEELANLYMERWEVEHFAREFKSEMVQAFTGVLRSKTPKLVNQEIVAALLAHYAIRAIMHEAALSIDDDVDRLSFKHTVSVIRRRATMTGLFPP